MKTIGIIDDRDVKRKSFSTKIRLALKKFHPGWNVIDRKPFLLKADYTQWILENGISVLILDEQLNAEAVEAGKKVSYSGHELVKSLRKNFKNLPIYSVTNFAITKDLRTSLSYFDFILSNRKFDEGLEEYLNLFVRMGTNFYVEYEKELARLSELSGKIADGKASPKEKKEAQALQTNMQIPHMTDNFQNREEYLSKLEESLKSMNELKGKLSKLLK